MKRIFLALLLAAPLVTFAAVPSDVATVCSLKAEPAKRKSELLAQAKVPPAEAQRIALDSSKGTKATKLAISSESGCLVYMFLVRNEPENTQTEVWLDAGNGKVLGQTTGPAPAEPVKQGPVDNVKEFEAQAAKIARERAASGPPKATPPIPPKK